jgi:hypothetical protein
MRVVKAPRGGEARHGPVRRWELLLRRCGEISGAQPCRVVRNRHSIPLIFAMHHSPTDSLDGSLNAAVTHFEMSDASFRQGALYALVYVIFALTITATAVWVWPRLGPWFWAHI